MIVNPIRFLVSCVPTVPVWKKPPQIYRKLFHVTTCAVAKHVVHLSWEYHVYQSVSLSQISELLLISSWCRHHGSLAWNLWVHVNIQVYLESVYTVKKLLLKVSWIFLKTLFQVCNPEFDICVKFQLFFPRYQLTLLCWHHRVFFYWLVTCSQSDWKACLDSWDVCLGFLSGWVIFPPHYFLLFVPREQN